MFTYFINSHGVIQRSDNSFIPADPGNRDYQDYLTWVAAGNTATPYSAPAVTWTDIQTQAKAQLDDSDVSVNRITEAVSLGLTSLTTPDVVTFFQWRRNLRNIVHTATGDPTVGLPAKPAYPANT